MELVSEKKVREIFAPLESGDAERFFSRVAENVNWTVMGTHALAGTYHSREAFLAGTFRRLNPLLKEGVLLQVTSVLACGDTAAVELEALSTAKNGKPFNNRYGWVCRFEKEMIVEVRAYLDSALVQKLIDENEPEPVSR